jgi:multicomponent K+:H+ antiporter subunit D
VILGTTFIGVIGFARAGSAVFWKAAPDAAAPAPLTTRADFAAPVIALLVLAALSAGAGWASAYANAAAAQVLDPTLSAAVVLAEAAP